jgi:hypothetical protein
VPPGVNPLSTPGTRRQIDGSGAVAQVSVRTERALDNAPPLAGGAEPNGASGAVGGLNQGGSGDAPHYQARGKCRSRVACRRPNRCEATLFPPCSFRCASGRGTPPERGTIAARHD